MQYNTTLTSTNPFSVSVQSKSTFIFCAATDMLTLSVYSMVRPLYIHFDTRKHMMKEDSGGAQQLAYLSNRHAISHRREISPPILAAIPTL